MFPKLNDLLQALDVILSEIPGDTFDGNFAEWIPMLGKCRKRRSECVRKYSHLIPLSFTLTKIMPINYPQYPTSCRFEGTFQEIITISWSQTAAENQISFILPCLKRI
jgi:hypothetical protein